MSFNFVADRIVNGKAYPALAQHQAEPYTQAWQEFIDHWPQTVPCELLEHLTAFNIPYNLYSIEDQYPKDSIYLIGIGFFDFTVDYFALLTPEVKHALKTRQLRAVFYYHEGDHPLDVKNYLNACCAGQGLPFDCFRLVSGNTSADSVDGCVYFPDHELLYWRRNSAVTATAVHNQPRAKDFTVLSRTHKWWRASILADLHRNNILENSYWSYNTDVTVNQQSEENSIKVDELNLRDYLYQFIERGPYSCDDLSEDDHNNHALTVTDHYTNSLCNIVLETHLNVDHSDGAFLTEKIFKPIKHGQPFVIAGGFKSLATLRALGYRVFDSVIDNTYDEIYDDTDRWRHLFQQIVKIKRMDPMEFIEQCRPDLEHNQQLFLSSKADRLNNLLERLK